jgi:hypothetical protein
MYIIVIILVFKHILPDILFSCAEGMKEEDMKSWYAVERKYGSRLGGAVLVYVFE